VRRCLTTFPEDGFEPTLEKVAHPPMAAMGHLGIDAVELTHAPGKVGVGRLHDQIIRVGHLARRGSAR